MLSNVYFLFFGNENPTDWLSDGAAVAAAFAAFAAF